MAENPWGPDVVPHPLDEFDTPTTAVSWTLQDSAVLDQTFLPAALAWNEHDWLVSLGFPLAAEGGGMIPYQPWQQRGTLLAQ